MDSATEVNEVDAMANAKSKRWWNKSYDLPTIDLLVCGVNFLMVALLFLPVLLPYSLYVLVTIGPKACRGILALPWQTCLHEWDRRRAKR